MNDSERMHGTLSSSNSLSGRLHDNDNLSGTVSNVDIQSLTDENKALTEKNEELIKDMSTMANIVNKWQTLLTKY